MEHGHDEDLSSGYCRCAQVNAIIAGTAMVDEQTSGLNLVSLVGDALRTRASWVKIAKQGRFFLAVALMASGAEQLICARSALPVRYIIPWAPGSQGLRLRILVRRNQ